MNTPVVDDKGNIIGDLILYQDESDRPFRRLARMPLNAMPRAKDYIPSVAAEISYVTFEHRRLYSQRDLGQPRYELKVVTVDQPDLLMRVNGYRPIAEALGKECVSPYSRQGYRGGIKGNG
jgi:hypothetical protein